MNRNETPSEGGYATQSTGQSKERTNENDDQLYPRNATDRQFPLLDTIRLDLNSARLARFVSFRLEIHPCSNDASDSIQHVSGADGGGGVVVALFELVRVVCVAVAAGDDIVQNAHGLSAVIVGVLDFAGVPVNSHLSAVAAAVDLLGRRVALVPAAEMFPGLGATPAAVDVAVDDQGAVVFTGEGGRIGGFKSDLDGQGGLSQGHDGAEFEELHGD